MGFIWNNHKELEGKHAFMGASNYHWLNYDERTFELRWYSQFSQIIGTAIHELAHDCIVSRTKLNKHDIHLIEMTLYKAFVPKNAYDPGLILENLMPFVNDAIGFHMSSEVLLFYNTYCFGTTDAIGYYEKERVLRIHDLKNGITQADFRQLYIYAALFCLEYKVDPKKLNLIECRIYQNMEVIIDNPSGDVIKEIMDTIEDRAGLIRTYLEREGR